MKKKMYLAVLAMCIALSATACGEKTTKEPTETEAKADQTEEKKEEKTETKKTSDTRLVTVDKIEKYLTLGEYKGIEVENNVMLVTDDDVESQIDTELMNGAEETTDAAQNGDIVTINYVGTKDGVAFEGGTANNYDLTLGSGGMVPGFEEGIVGMKKGETKDVNLTFPEEYYEELAGADVVFKITCQNVRRKAELTDKWAADHTEYSNVEEYREGVRAKLEENAQGAAQEKLKNDVWDKIMENSEIIEYPQEDIDNAAAEFKKMITLYADQAGMDLDKFIESQGMTTEQFEEQAQQYAELKVKQLLVIQAIMDAEGFSLDDEECLKLQDELIVYSGSGDLAGMLDRYGQQAIDESIGLMRVENFAAENANVVEKVTNGDTTAENAESGSMQQTPDEDDVVDAELDDGSDVEDDETVEIGEE